MDEEDWFSRSGIEIDSELTGEQRMQVITLLWIWRDMFVEMVEDLPATNLVTHTIPTYPHCKAYQAKDPIYAKDEVRWQNTELPKMIGIIVERGSSPWVAKTTWVAKKETVVDEIGRWPLRMVHTYCQLNNATIKMNYPLKRMEPILDELANPDHQYFFSADAAYGFYAVPIYPPHAYKIAFNTMLGQFYYLRMPMGLTGAPATYARLKDLAFGPIPAPQSEPPVFAGPVTFKYFFDDDYGAANTFDQLLQFLHDIYFPQIHWARLTLKPSKSQFFVPSIEPLGMTVGRHPSPDGKGVLYGMRANDKKRGKIEAFPTHKNEKEVEAFLYLTTYLKTLIPGRTELARIMKEAVIYANNKKPKEVVGFEWKDDQQNVFDRIKEAIHNNIIVGGDSRRRYYLSVVADKCGFGAVLFELMAEDEAKLENAAKTFPKGKERVVQFISQVFLDAETRYPEIERECLAVLRSLEEVRFLILQSSYPVAVYTDASALSILKRAEGAKGRIAGWQVRLEEFNTDFRHCKVKDMAIANGLARVPYDQPWKWCKEFEDVYVVEFGDVYAAEFGDQSFQPAGVKIEYRLHNKGLIVGDDAILIYTDGACRGNGTPDARASIGVYAGPNNPRNQGFEIRESDQRLTNQVAELFALIYAVQTGVEIVRAGGHFDTKKLVIVTDSEYAYDGITKWIIKWKEKDYQDVQNALLFDKLDQLVIQAGISIQFWKISREDNVEAYKLARIALDGDEEERVRYWKKWLDDHWYGDITSYLLFERVRQLKASPQRLRRVKRESRRFALRDCGAPQLSYQETNGDISTCAMPDQVEAILRRFHDNHGHFAAGNMGRNLLERYYWPGRIHDVTTWCRTWEACQRLGLLRNSTQVQPVLSLQPMDLMGMDFLGPITPHSKSGSVYILLAIDYFSRYLFAHATKRNTGEAVVQFLESKVARTFGWPLAFYVDNGSHFVKGKLPERLKEVGTKLFSAPITNPRSVGLIERNIQLVLARLRAMVGSPEVWKVGGENETISHWNEYLDNTIHAINTRVLKVHGYSPLQLFLGFNIRLHPLDRLATENMRSSLIDQTFNTLETQDNPQPQLREYDLRLASIEEMRELTRERVLLDQEARILQAQVPRYEAPQLGDLVLRRRFQVDKSLGMKLHAKWDGPYRLCRISKSGVSGDLEDLKTGKVIGRYAFESLKVYVPREQGCSELEGEWVSHVNGLKKEEYVRGRVIYL